MAATLVRARGNTDYAGLVADIYLRESDSRRRSRTGKDIRGGSRSIGEQEDGCRSDIDRIGATAGELFRDKDRGASTYSKGARKDWDRLIRKLESPDRPDILVCWECARGTRDLEVYVALRAICRRTGVLWMYNGRVYDLADTSDAFITGLDVLSAEREAGMTHDRVMRGTESRAASGRPHGRMLYGYTRRYAPDTGEFLEQLPEPQTAPIVREIFAAVADDGIGLCALATRLNRRNVPTPAGSPAWRTASLRRILTNRGYLGERTANGATMVAGAWPALVDELTWWAAQARLEQRRLEVDGKRETRPDTTVKYLLSGIAKCGVCNASVVSNKGYGDGRYAAYLCHGKQCVGRSRRHLDDYVTELVLAMLETEPEIGRTDTPDLRLGEALRALTGYRAQLEAFEEQAIAGELTAAAYARIEQRIMPKIAAAEQTLRTLQRRTQLPDTGGRGIRDAWNTPEYEGGLSLADKRSIIRSVVAIRILPTGSGKRFDPAAVEVTRLDLGA